MKRVYFKSFGRRGEGLPLESSIINPKTNELSTCQTLDEVIRTRTLNPNTRHHGLADRLCVSLPSSEFPGSYRPEGILFTTAVPPKYCSPVDIMALTAGRTFTHQDYGSDFLQGYEEFLFPDVESMNQVFPNSDLAILRLNQFREQHGLDKLDERRTYNEMCFEGQIPIKPISLVGESQEIRDLSERHRVKNHPSIAHYLATVKRRKDVFEMVKIGSLATAAAGILLASNTLAPKSLERMGEEYLALGTSYFQR